MAGCASAPTPKVTLTGDVLLDGPKMAAEGLPRDRVLWQYRTAAAAMRQGKFEVAKPLLDDALRTLQGIFGPDAEAPVGLRPQGGASVDRQLRPDGVAATGLELRPPGAAVPPASPRVRPAVVEPLAPARYKVQFTASAELHDKLERLRALMRSSVPDGDLAAIVEQAVTEKLQRLEARRFARTETPRRTLSESETSPTTRQIPAAVKRAVYERDGGRCRYEDEQGRRCTARQGLEFHHRRPFGHGGDHSVANISLACKCHNGYLAEVDHGREAIARHRRAGTRPLEPTPSPSP